MLKKLIAMQMNDSDPCYYDEDPLSQSGLATKSCALGARPCTYATFSRPLDAGETACIIRAKKYFPAPAAG